jgi:molecular chaperone HscB
MSEDYFQYFGLNRNFFIDTEELKKLYYAKSKESHPDFHTLNELSHQEKMMDLSSYNNLAYKTLKDLRSRVYYILELEGMVKNEGENTLPQAFLMDMMDVNEKIMELEIDYDHQVYESIDEEVSAMQKGAFSEIEPLMRAYDSGDKRAENLVEIRDFYFKQKYLWRIKENLDKFATGFQDE